MTRHDGYDYFFDKSRYPPTRAWRLFMQNNFSSGHLFFNRQPGSDGSSRRTISMS
jgi:hypothetical protein